MMRPSELKNVSKRQKTVTRAYGGSRCARCVRTRCAVQLQMPDAKVQESDFCLGDPCGCFKCATGKAPVVRVRGRSDFADPWRLMRAALRRRIVRAFLIEERQLVKKVLKAQAVTKPSS
uniref:60S ribosomal protein L34 n=1 Tax=Chrysotila carterae TaxID=13221 RepID=A0A7S4B283_CHRCT